VPGLLGEQKPSSRVGQDPSRIAQANEQRERLAAALEKLSPRQRRIWQILWEGGSRREIAKEFGVTYAKAKRWGEEVIAMLRAAAKEKYHRSTILLWDGLPHRPRLAKLASAVPRCKPLGCRWLGQPPGRLAIRQRYAGCCARPENSVPATRAGINIARGEPSR
jgi:hypothetical protein